MSVIRPSGDVRTYAEAGSAQGARPTPPAGSSDGGVRPAEPLARLASGGGGGGTGGNQPRSNKGAKQQTGGGSGGGVRGSVVGQQAQVQGVSSAGPAEDGPASTRRTSGQHPPQPLYVGGPKGGQQRAADGSSSGGNPGVAGANGQHAAAPAVAAGPPVVDMTAEPLPASRRTMPVTAQQQQEQPPPPPPPQPYPARSAQHPQQTQQQQQQQQKQHLMHQQHQQRTAAAGVSEPRTGGGVGAAGSNSGAGAAAPVGGTNGLQDAHALRSTHPDPSHGPLAATAANGGPPPPPSASRPLPLGHNLQTLEAGLLAAAAAAATDVTGLEQQVALMKGLSEQRMTVDKQWLAQAESMVVTAKRQAGWEVQEAALKKQLADEVKAKEGAEEEVRQGRVQLQAAQADAAAGKLKLQKEESEVKALREQLTERANLISQRDKALESSKAELGEVRRTAVAATSAAAEAAAQELAHVRGEAAIGAASAARSTSLLEQQLCEATAARDRECAEKEDARGAMARMRNDMELAGLGGGGGGGGGGSFNGMHLQPQHLSGGGGDPHWLSGPPLPSPQFVEGPQHHGGGGMQLGGPGSKAPPPGFQSRNFPQHPLHLQQQQQQQQQQPAQFGALGPLRQSLDGGTQLPLGGNGGGGGGGGFLGLVPSGGDTYGPGMEHVMMGPDQQQQLQQHHHQQHHQQQQHHHHQQHQQHMGLLPPPQQGPFGGAPPLAALQFGGGGMPPPPGGFPLVDQHPFMMGGGGGMPPPSQGSLPPFMGAPQRQLHEKNDQELHHIFVNLLRERGATQPQSAIVLASAELSALDAQLAPLTWDGYYAPRYQATPTAYIAARGFPVNLQGRCYAPHHMPQPPPHFSPPQQQQQQPFHLQNVPPHLQLLQQHAMPPHSMQQSQMQMQHSPPPQQQQQQPGGGGAGHPVVQHSGLLPPPQATSVSEPLLLSPHSAGMAVPGGQQRAAMLPPQPQQPQQQQQQQHQHQQQQQQLPMGMPPGFPSQLLFGNMPATMPPGMAGGQPGMLTSADSIVAPPVGSPSQSVGGAGLAGQRPTWPGPPPLAPPAGGAPVAGGQGGGGMPGSDGGSNYMLSKAPGTPAGPIARPPPPAGGPSALVSQGSGGAGQQRPSSGGSAGAPQHAPYLPLKAAAQQQPQQLPPAAPPNAGRRNSGGGGPQQQPQQQHGSRPVSGASGEHPAAVDGGAPSGGGRGKVHPRGATGRSG